MLTVIQLFTVSEPCLLPLFSPLRSSVVERRDKPLFAPLLVLPARADDECSPITRWPHGSTPCRRD